MAARPGSRPVKTVRLGTLGGSTQALGYVYKTGWRRAKLIQEAFADHINKRWGDIPHLLKKRNERSLRDGSAEIVSMHGWGTRLYFFIVTSADRTATRVMLEDELSEETFKLIKGLGRGSSRASP